MQKAKYNRMIIEIHDSLRSGKKVFEKHVGTFWLSFDRKILEIKDPRD